MSPFVELVATLAPLGVFTAGAITGVSRWIAGRFDAERDDMRAQIAARDVTIAKLDARLEDRDATIKGLGAKRDEDRSIADERVEAERKKTFRVAELMIRRSTVEQIQAIDEEDFGDIPTMLHRAIVVSKAAVTPPTLPESEEQRLQRYNEDKPLTTPPEPLQPRKRQLSRSR
jgi:hypothetical protein